MSKAPMSAYEKPAIGDLYFSTPDEARDLVETAYAKTGGPTDALLKAVEQNRDVMRDVLAAANAA